LSLPAVERPVSQPRWPVLVYWLPTLIWLGVLTWFSTDTFSAEHTGRVLARVIHFLFGDVSRLTFEHVHLLVRKSAHFFSYGLLSFFAFYTWRASLPLTRAWALRWSLLALLLTLAAGCTDEFHQSFVASRTSSLRDVGIDMAGALTFQFVIAWVVSRRVSGRVVSRKNQ
jgi:VanZ family protein